MNAVLARHMADLGGDAVGYRHHVYRVVNLCVAFAPDGSVPLEQIEIAAVFHDLGIWTAGTFDYLEPSVVLAADHLAKYGGPAQLADVTAMIREHHKVTAYRGPGAAIVEAFRRADWVDVSRGLLTCGLPRTTIARIRGRWPDAGFHRRLLQLSAARLVRHPLDPLPMLRP